MSMTFHDVKRVIKEGTLGRDVGNDYWIKCDGVATGREQLNFMIDELREQYENKRVFELPAYVITELKTIKEDNGNDNLQGFMNDVNDDDEIWQSVEEFNRSGMPTDALLGEWWLGHVEFVAKKEQKFYIKIVDVFDEYGNEFYLASMGNNEFRMTTYTDRAEMFKKEEADKIISDVLNSVVALRARKVEVED